MLVSWELVFIRFPNNLWTQGSAICWAFQEPVCQGKPFNTIGKQMFSRCFVSKFVYQKGSSTIYWYHWTTKKHFFHHVLKPSTYPGLQYSAEYDAVIRFSFEHTLFLYLYVKILKITTLNIISIAITPNIFYIKITFLPLKHIKCRTLFLY